jgi:hypothetical protein
MKPGRRSAEGTGSALEDVAAAWLVYAHAVASGVGTTVDLAADPRPDLAPRRAGGGERGHRARA